MTISALAKQGLAPHCAAMNDHITRYATSDHLAIAVVRCTDTVATIAAQHGLQGEPLRVLGEAITASLLMATRLKGPGVMHLSLRNQGVFAHLRVDAIGLGSVRAMITETVREQLLQWNGVDPLLGAGEIEVSKQLAQDQQAYRSTIALERGDATWAANRYLATSEQVDACVLSDVRVRKAQTIEATGVYIERLPGADEDESGVQHLRRHQLALTEGNPMGIAGDQDDDGLIQRLVPGSELVRLHQYDVGFHCPCSRDRFVSSLRSIANDQLHDLADNGILETTCEFCRTSYEIPLDEVT